MDSKGFVSKSYWFSLSVGLLAVLMFVNVGVSQAADIPITTYVSGGLTLVLNGGWQTGITFSDVSMIPGYETDVTGYWNENESLDYISFVDDTGTSVSGFYITIKVTDFAYSGSDPVQGAINANKYKLYAEYSGGEGSAPIKGYDDPTQTLSILPDSCAGATTSTFTFNADFSDSAKSYRLTGLNTAQTLVSSTANCINKGHVRFDRKEFTVPAYSAPGAYTGTITFTIFDGAP